MEIVHTRADSTINIVQDKIFVRLCVGVQEQPFSLRKLHTIPVSGHVGIHLPLSHFFSTTHARIGDHIYYQYRSPDRHNYVYLRLTKLSHPLTFRATEDANSACARKLHKNGGQSGNRLLVLLVRGEFLVSDDKSCMAVSTTKHVQSTQETMV